MAVNQLTESLTADAPSGKPLDQLPLRGIEEHLVLRRSDLGFDDLDGEVFLVAASEPGGAIPDGLGARAGGHGDRP